MQSLVDVRQVIAMQAMINSTEKIENYVGALNNAAGAGREMAAIMEDSTKGAFKRFTSALEGLFLVLSEKVAPVVNSVSKGIREWIEYFTDATDKKISDRMRLQVKEFENLFDVVQRTTATEKTRQMALAEINRKYSEFLGYQLTDINDTNNLAKAEKLLNDEFEKRIELQVAEEGLANFYKEQEKRAFRLYKLQKDMKGLLAKQEFNTFGDIQAQGQQRALDISKKLFDFISDYDPKKDGADVSGFFQNLEFLAIGAGMEIGKMITTPMELFKDMDNFAELKVALDEIASLQAEVAEEAKDEAWFRERILKLGGKLKKLIDKGGVEPCPSGQHRDPNTGECVDAKAVRDFAEELAIFKRQVSDRESEHFIKNEEQRNLKILEKEKDLAKDELAIYKEGDKRRAAMHLKYLKAVEKADKASLKIREDRLDEGLLKTKRRLAQEGRDKKHSTLELQREDLEAEKKMLEKKLELYKNYSSKRKKIMKQLEVVEENIKINDYETEVELKQFKVELAQEIANATFSIMSNNLARSKEAQLNSLQNTYDNEMHYFDIQLRDKLISQADYDGKKQIKDHELKLEEERLNNEFARKEKNAARAQAIINGALAITKVQGQTGTLSPFVIPMIVATTMAQLAVIESQQFAKGGMIEKFANGGMVRGKSHAQGGEKFAVGGRVVELEGGEAVINKRSTAMFKPQLSAMNAAGGGVKFADGGLLNQSSFSAARFNSAGFGQMGGGKVVVVESDITTTQRKVQAIENNASF